MADVKKIKVVIGADTKELDKGVKKAGKAVDKFGQQIKQVAGAVAAAFAVDRIARFSAEAVQLAAKGEGIRTAFAKLNDPMLLDDLKRATRSTVSEIELMQKAVQANNFKIPLERLATFFEFATNRAIETGESVDYLVESIVTGIGRKSVLVMDNLGISAVELQEEVARVGDFGEAAAIIIQREMEKAGNVIDTAATQMAQYNAQWKDFKENYGKAGIRALVNLQEFINTGLNPTVFIAEKYQKKYNDELERLNSIVRKIPDEALDPLNLFDQDSLSVGNFRASGFWRMANMIAEMDIPPAIPAIKEIEDFKMPTELKDLLDGHVFDFSEGPGFGALFPDEETQREQLDYFERILKKFEETNDEAGALANTIGIQMVLSFANMGDAIGKAMAGAEDSLESLGQAIFQNIGNILMMAGLSAVGGVNVAMVAAGAALQLGSGIFGGFRGAQQDQPGTNNAAIVNFQISGSNLSGTQRRYADFKNIVT